MGGRSKKPKPPKPTAEEKATEIRTDIGLRRERMKTERMLKAQARGQLGAKSLLTGLRRDASLKQEDVKHSKSRSSESRDFAKMHPIAAIMYRAKYGKNI